MTPAVADLPPLSVDWLRRGQLALRWGRRAEARRCLQSAVAADSRNAMAWILLARLSAPRARLAYLAHALELNPAHALAHAELRRARRAMEAPPSARRVPESVSRPRRQFSAWLWLTLFSIFGVFGAMAVAPGLWPPRPAEAPANAVFNGLSKATFTASPSSTHTLIPSATPTATFTPAPTETATPLPTATPSMPLPESVKSDERWIDVDLSEQTLLAYEGAMLLQTFIVSTGVWEHPTVTGQFHIYVKYPAADMAGPGYYLPAVPYVMYFYQDYGLHGTYWHSNFGTPMSHGCVNLRTEDAAWLFDWASVGTVVNVHD